MIPFLAEMKAIHDETEIDADLQNPMFDPPTLSWNIVIDDGNSAANVTSPKTTCRIYTRPMPGVDLRPLLERTRRAAAAGGLDLEIFDPDSTLNTDPASPFVREALTIANRTRALTVSYGTDGGIFRELENLIVCGPGDIAQAHTRDEWISIDQLARGTELYSRMIARWCCEDSAASERAGSGQ
jgi:acetylornithine deacetylase